MQQQPQFIPMLLQQIAQSDPQMAAAVQQNPEAFVRLLQNPELYATHSLTPTHLLFAPCGVCCVPNPFPYTLCCCLHCSAARLLAASAQGGGGGGGGGGGAAANQPRTITVQFTAEEKKAVDNVHTAPTSSVLCAAVLDR